MSRPPVSEAGALVRTLTPPRPSVTVTVRACARACAAGRVLTAWLSGSVHGDFDGAVVGGDLRRPREHGDGQREALPCSAQIGSVRDTHVCTFSNKSFFFKLCAHYNHFATIHR